MHGSFPGSLDYYNVLHTNKNASFKNRSMKGSLVDCIGQKETFKSDACKKKTTNNQQISVLIIQIRDDGTVYNEMW